MPLPSIKISFLNGQLGTVPSSQDGLLALVCGATQVASTFSLEKAYTIYRLAGLDALGVTAENNAALYRHVKDFYTEAAEGTPLVVYGVEKTEKMTDLCDKDSGPLKGLLQAMKGALRGLVIARDPGEEVVSVTEGLDPDVFTAIPKAQALAEWATTDLYAPIFVALEGRSFDGDADSLQNLSEQTNNRVCVVIGDTTAGSEGAAMGLLAARIASASVQRNIGRVADGAIAATEMYLGDKPVEEVMDAITTIYDKGYITPRTYVGKSGYFWTDDKLATEPTDDYAHLTHRRVVDKAYRIAYDTLLNYMLDEIMVNTDGTMQQAVLKSWQSAVESAIDNQMTAQGELSADLTAGESGCSCYIDPSQNVLATSTVNITLKVRPYGYARYIVVELGFLVEAQS